ncbi:MAG TPA: sigma-70 family RNA polymerase sigma factor [Microbacteriaceae bacterium]|jgi:RNA polymerase sigma factor, sigma-70 family
MSNTAQVLDYEAQQARPSFRVVSHAPRRAATISGGSVDAVRDYLQRIGQFPVLSAEEEADLSRRIEVGLFAQERLDSGKDTDSGTIRDLRWLVRDGNKAYERFVSCNLKLVVSVAKRYSGCGVPLIDLIQEGNVGLDRAVKKFDHEKGFKFSTYAMWWIRQSISRSIADTGALIRVPVHTAEKITKLTRMSRELSITLGREATFEEIAAEAQLDAEEVQRLLSVDRDGVSLQTSVGDESFELGDLIEDADLIPVADIVSIGVRNDELHKRVGALPHREAQILQFRYGLKGGRPMTFEQVGSILGVSRERVRQLETRALKMLRCPELHDYLA